MSDRLYSFVFRGVLAEEALDRAGRKSKLYFSNEEENQISSKLPFDELDEEFISKAKKMAIVYCAIAAFENSVRAFITKKLLEEVKANWWTICVDEDIRKKADGRMEEEKKIKWHAVRGVSPINYTEMKHLSHIIRKNWKYFEPHLISVDWVTNILDTVERSRNVIMHSGDLGNRDIERIGTHIRDWIRQVGG